MIGRILNASSSSPDYANCQELRVTCDRPYDARGDGGQPSRGLWPMPDGRVRAGRPTGPGTGRSGPGRAGSPDPDSLCYGPGSSVDSVTIFVDLTPNPFALPDICRFDS